MADCKRCDRCGAVYVPNYDKYCNGSCLIATAPQNIRSKWRYNGQGVVVLDICDDCRADFERWFNDGRKRASQ